MDNNLENTRLIKLIRQSIKNYKLDLSGYSILLPVLSKEPMLIPLIASLAGAREIYAISKDLTLVKEITSYKNELNLESSFYFIEKETPQILKGLDIVIKGDIAPIIDDTVAASFKKQCIISLFPKNLDFAKANGINLEACAKNKIPVVSLDPGDPSLSLFKHISSLVIKKLNGCDIDIFKSKILLVGSGNLLENILVTLKSAGCQVFAVYTDKSETREYVSKHIGEADAIVLADYPSKQQTIIGNNGIIRIADLVDVNPEVKIINISGKVEVNPLLLGGISLIPETVSPNSINVNIEELSLRSITEITSAVMKVAESLIKSRNKTILPSDSIVSFNIVNSDGPFVPGKIMF